MWSDTLRLPSPRLLPPPPVLPRGVGGRQQHYNFVAGHGCHFVSCCNFSAPQCASTVVVRFPRGLGGGGGRGASLGNRSLGDPGGGGGGFPPGGRDAGGEGIVCPPPIQIRWSDERVRRRRCSPRHSQGAKFTPYCQGWCRWDASTLDEGTECMALERHARQHVGVRSTGDACARPRGGRLTHSMQIVGCVRVNRDPLAVVCGWSNVQCPMSQCVVAPAGPRHRRVQARQCPATDSAWATGRTTGA